MVSVRKFFQKKVKRTKKKDQNVYSTYLYLKV